MQYDNYYGTNTPDVLAAKSALCKVLTNIAKRYNVYDNEDGWSEHDLYVLSHEMWYAGYDATSPLNLLVAAVCGSGVVSANEAWIAAQERRIWKHN